MREGNFFPPFILRSTQYCGYTSSSLINMLPMFQVNTEQTVTGPPDRDVLIGKNFALKKIPTSRKLHDFSFYLVFIKETKWQSLCSVAIPL